MNSNPRRGSLRAFPTERRLAILGLLCAVAGGGCGEEAPEGRLPVHPASGTVSVNGRPATGVLVVLHPADGSPSAKEGATPSATTRNDGTFQLTTYEQNDGAPAGDYSVTIQGYRADPQTANGRPTIPGGPPKDRFGGKFNNPTTSQWQVTITEGDNVLKPITVD